MASKFPPELWLETFQYIDYTTLQASIKPVSRNLYNLASTVKLAGPTTYIWVKTLEHLEYKDLALTASITCKTFCKIVRKHSSPILSATMLRETMESVQPINESTVIRQHPLFNLLHCTHGPDGDEVLHIGLSVGDTSKALESFPAAYDNATSPPATEVVLNHGRVTEKLISHQQPEVYETPPVTVIDVMAATLLMLVDECWCKGYNNFGEAIAKGDESVELEIRRPD